MEDHGALDAAVGRWWIGLFALLLVGSFFGLASLSARNGPLVAGAALLSFLVLMTLVGGSLRRVRRGETRQDAHYGKFPPTITIWPEFLELNEDGLRTELSWDRIVGALAVEGAVAIVQERGGKRFSEDVLFVDQGSMLGDDDVPEFVHTVENLANQQPGLPGKSGEE